MDKKIIITAKSAAGKDYLLLKFKQSARFKVGVKHTTRPMREHEIEGLHYHYTCNTAFDLLIQKNQMFVYQEFYLGSDKLWKYGFTNFEIENNDVFMLTPSEIKSISNDRIKDFVIVYLDIDKDVRRQRLLKRGDANDNVDRRIESDEVDFYDFSTYHVKIKDPNFTFEDVIDLINAI
jgi:guanylate kinase